MALNKDTLERLWLIIESHLYEKVDNEKFVDTIEKIKNDKKTVKGDTLYWDGNTENKFGIPLGSGAFYYVSDALPTVEELSMGGTMVFGTDTVLFNADSVYKDSFLMLDCPGIVLLAPGHRMDWLLGAIFVYQDNLTIDIGQGPFALEKKGTYLLGSSYGGTDKHVKSLTINGYNGFEREVIKDELLPSKWSDLGGDLFYEDILTWNGEPTEIASTSHGCILINKDDGSRGEITWFKVSDATPTPDEMQSAVVTIRNGESEETIEIDSSKITGNPDYYYNIDKYVKVVYEANANIAANTTVATGTYFAMHTNDPSVFVTSLYIPGYNKWRSVKKLPNDYLDILENVGTDTVYYDGDLTRTTTNFGFYRHVSNAIPTIQELQQGGSVISDEVINSIRTDVVTNFTASDIIDAESEGLGNGCILIPNLTGTGGDYGDYMICVVSKPGATITLQNEYDESKTLTFYKTGTYFIYNGSTRIKALTINGYTGFTKESIKKEYLPEGISNSNGTFVWSSGSNAGCQHGNVLSMSYDQYNTMTAALNGITKIRAEFGTSSETTVTRELECFKENYYGLTLPYIAKGDYYNAYPTYIRQITVHITEDPDIMGNGDPLLVYRDYVVNLADGKTVTLVNRDDTPPAYLRAIYAL